MQQQEVIISLPASQDILCGSGAQVNGHEGNKIFRQVARKHYSVYARATTKPQKMRATKLVFDELAKTGSRFLKKDPVFDLWYLLGDKAARDKISHCLRVMLPGEETEPVPTSKVVTKKLKTKDATPVKSKEPTASPTAVLSADISMQPSPAEHLVLEHERSEATMPLSPPSPVIEATQSSLIKPALHLHQTGHDDKIGFLQEIDPFPREELEFPAFETWCQANFGVSPPIEDYNFLYPHMEKCPTSTDALFASRQSACQIFEALGP